VTLCIHGDLEGGRRIIDVRPWIIQNLKLVKTASAKGGEQWSKEVSFFPDNCFFLANDYFFIQLLFFPFNNYYFLATLLFSPDNIYFFFLATLFLQNTGHSWGTGRLAHH